MYNILFESRKNKKKNSKWNKKKLKISGDQKASIDIEINKSCKYKYF